MVKIVGYKYSNDFNFDDDENAVSGLEDDEYINIQFKLNYFYSIRLDFDLVELYCTHIQCIVHLIKT